MGSPFEDLDAKEPIQELKSNALQLVVYQLVSFDKNRGKNFVKSPLSKVSIFEIGEFESVHILRMYH